MNRMEKLLHTGDQYLKSMDLEDMAALKFCLSSMGVILGIGVPMKLKKPVGLLAGLLFLGTYVPLVSKFVDMYSGIDGAPEEYPIAAIHEEPPTKD